MKIALRLVRLALILALTLLARAADFDIVGSLLIGFGTVTFLGLVAALDIIYSPGSDEIVAKLRKSWGIG